MGSYLVLILFAFLVAGVFSDADEVKMATEGNPFILNPGVTKQYEDMVLWYFNNTLIAQIDGEPSTSCVYEGEGGRFRDRLMVLCETGSLIITDVRSEHAGDYEAEILRNDSSGKSYVLNIKPKCDPTKINRKSSSPHKIKKSVHLTVYDEVKTVTEGNPFILNTGVTKQHEDIVWWYFNNIRIAQINGEPNTSCVYDGEGGRFKDKLMVHCETGSLIITDVRSEHAGDYEAEIISSDRSGKHEVLNLKPKCDPTKINRRSSSPDEIKKSVHLTVSASKADKNEKEPQKSPHDQKMDANPCLSPADVAGIVVGVLLLVAAAVVLVCMIYYRHKRFTNEKDMKKNIQGLLQG